MKTILFSIILALIASVSCLSQDSQFTLITSKKDKISKTNNGKNILNPAAIFLARPEYPLEAKDTNAIGIVEVDVLINEEGVVKYAKAISGPELLKKSAENAAKASQFNIDHYLLGSNPLLARKEFTGVLVFDFSKLQTYGNDSFINGKAKKLVIPSYPEKAIGSGAVGTVTVNVTVDEAGKTISAKMITGHPFFKEAAEKAALKSTFNKDIASGVPTKYPGVIIYYFSRHVRVIIRNRL